MIHKLHLNLELVATQRRLLLIKIHESGASPEIKKNMRKLAVREAMLTQKVATMQRRACAMHKIGASLTSVLPDPLSLAVVCPAGRACARWRLRRRFSALASRCTWSRAPVLRGAAPPQSRASPAQGCAER